MPGRARQVKWGLGRVILDPGHDAGHRCLEPTAGGIPLPLAAAEVALEQGVHGAEAYESSRSRRGDLGRGDTLGGHDAQPPTHERLRGQGELCPIDRDAIASPLARKRTLFAGNDAPVELDHRLLRHIRTVPDSSSAHPR